MKRIWLSKRDTNPNSRLENYSERTFSRVLTARVSFRFSVRGMGLVARSRRSVFQKSDRAAGNPGHRNGKRHSRTPFLASGAFCARDARSRQWTQEEIEILSELDTLTFTAIP